MCLVIGVLPSNVPSPHLSVLGFCFAYFYYDHFSQLKVGMDIPRHNRFFAQRVFRPDAFSGKWQLAIGVVMIFCHMDLVWPFV